ncbi:ABC transporter ATP-binding protein [Streptosporangium sp. NPDC000396]|uniref:ABC transporter ATP-binding protein n=1 Tax=Streptosporangium sp. NPDC000396 TaxID=3366185 RepID=UPI0036B7B1EA
MTALLDVTGLVRRYGPLVAVDHVDLHLPAGARHALIGPNGAGKSTLLNLIAGTVRPSAGRVRLAGRDITRAGPATRARLGIARTFQTPAVLDSLTALDNLAVGAWRHTGVRRRWRESRRREPARRDLLDALGLGAQAQLAAGTLSHGQRRMLEIAVALVAEPAVLLLDEPAAGLGDDDLPRLLAALHRLPAAMAVLLIEHNQDLVTAFADTVTVLHHGQVLATGTPQEIHGHPAVAEVYLGTPQEVS